MQDTTRLDIGFYAKYYKRHSPDDVTKSHTPLSDDEILFLAQKHWPKRTKSGAGWTVPIPPDHFFTPFVKLVEGDVMVAKVAVRNEGEEPRMNVYVRRADKTKGRANFVNLIVYEHAVLGEDAEHDLNILFPAASPVHDEPMDPSTFLHNVFELSGGSKPKNEDGAEWSAEQVRNEFKRSCAFKRQYAALAPDDDDLIELGAWSEGTLYIHQGLVDQLEGIWFFEVLMADAALDGDIKYVDGRTVR